MYTYTLQDHAQLVQWLETVAVFGLALALVAFALAVDPQTYAPAIEVVRP